LCSSTRRSARRSHSSSAVCMLRSGLWLSEGLPPGDASCSATGWHMRSPSAAGYWTRGCRRWPGQSGTGFLLNCAHNDRSYRELLDEEASRATS
jgi:hypothetical protein